METNEKNKVQTGQVEYVVESFFDNATRWYGYWLKMAKYAYFITTLIFFIWGIIDATTVYSIGYKEECYGIMRMSSGGLAWFLWQIIGQVVGGLIYLRVKLITSPIVLQTEFLKIIAENEKK